MSLSQKLISIGVLIAISLFGNMAILHAIEEENIKKKIPHTYHTIHQICKSSTTDTNEAPHCIKSKVDAFMNQQSRNSSDTHEFQKNSFHFFAVDNISQVEEISVDAYLQHYP